MKLNQQIIPLRPISLIGVIALTATSVNAALYTQGATDSWINPGNWDTGVPSGVEDVVIASGIAQVDSPGISAYTGNLTVESGTRLDLQFNDVAALRALGTGTITLQSTANIWLRQGFTVNIANSIIFLGNASILNQSNPTDNDTRNLSGDISGSGQFTYGMRRGNLLTLSGTNTWSGGFIANFSDTNFGNMSRVRADVNGAFGTGNLTFNDGIGLEISGSLGDAIDDDAFLFLNGRGRNSKLVLNSSETVNRLFVDGQMIGVGTYDSSSGLLDGFGNNLIGGSGSITVLTVPEPTTTALLGLGGLALILRRRR